MAPPITDDTAIRLAPAVLRIAEAAPLSLFLLLRATLNEADAGYWLTVYLVPAVAALVLLGLSMRLPMPLNRLLLGIDLYLLLGAAGLLTGQLLLNELLGRIEELGMLVVMVMVGITCRIIGTSFVGAGEASWGTGSNVLLAGTVLVTLLTWWWRQQPLYHETLPFLLLFGLQFLMVRRMPA